MSWGLEFKTNIYLSRQDYGENIAQVQDKIDEIEKYIQNIQNQINMFASANPKDITPKDWEEESIRWINNEIDGLIDQLHEYIVQQYQLELYKEYLEENK